MNLTLIGILMSVLGVMIEIMFICVISRLENIEAEARRCRQALEDIAKEFTNQKD